MNDPVSKEIPIRQYQTQKVGGSKALIMRKKEPNLQDKIQDDDSESLPDDDEVQEKDKTFFQLLFPCLFKEKAF